MADKSYILDITACHSSISKIKDVVRGFNDVLVLQVVGENRIVAVVHDPEEIRKICGDTCQIKCTPVRPYANFAHIVLGLDSNVANKKYNEDLTGGSIFWLHFKVEYQGKALDELKRRWKEEAKFVFAAKAGGLRCKLYKTIASREIHAFIVSEPDIMDDISFALPILKSLGDQVEVIAKEVQL